MPSSLRFSPLRCSLWGGKSKDFCEMLKQAKERGFERGYVLMDSWYSSPENLKIIARQGWFFLTRLESNRLMNPNDRNVPIAAVDFPSEGRVVHLRGFGWV